MALSNEAPTLAADAIPSAADHNALTLVVEEILQRRFNRRSPLVFATGVPGQPDLGDVFVFGTLSNLRGSWTPYNPEVESPAVPEPGQIVSYDTTTRVIWVTGITETPSPRRLRVLWTSPEVGATEQTWWLAWTRPERWRPLALADLLVEAYTDPVADSTSVFTLRSGWDKYGCVRVHNGNRFALTVAAEGTASTWTIPAYGVLTGRRSAPDGAWAFHRKYTAETSEGDTLTWTQPAHGQWAASMELCHRYLKANLDQGWLHVGPGIASSTTSADAARFGRSSISSDDPVVDWLRHRGTLLSVVLDKRDGTVVVTPLEWRGIGSVPDSTWTGIVDVTLRAANTELVFTSAASAPAGAASDEWEHDLIPVTSNILGVSRPVGIRSEFVAPLPVGCGPCYRALPDLSVSGLEVVEGDAVEKPHSLWGAGGGTAYTSRSIQFTGYTPGSISNWLMTVGEAFDSPGTGAACAETVLEATRLWGAIGCRRRVELNGANEISGLFLDGDAVTYLNQGLGYELGWDFSRGYGLGPATTHWDPVVPRAYQSSSDYVADGGGIDDGVWLTRHPQDRDVRGTADGLAGALGWRPVGIQSSGIALESTGEWGVIDDWSALDAASLNYGTLGRNVLRAPDALDLIVQNVNVSGWYAGLRDDLVAGKVPQEARRRAFRAPRRIAQWNDIARVLNAVVWVQRTTMADLHRDPIPLAAWRNPDPDSLPDAHLPFGHVGAEPGDPYEAPFAVPADWGAGLYDTEDALADWAAAWGLTLLGDADVPGIADLWAEELQVWAQIQEDRTDESTDPVDWVTWKWELALASTLRSEVTSSFGGRDYSNWLALSIAGQRLLFGGAGGLEGYLWTTRADLVASISDLVGVAPPPGVAGERYWPRLARDASVELIQGTVYGTVEDRRLDGNSSIPAGYNDAHEPIRDTLNVDAEGAESVWVRIVPERTLFRLSVPSGSEVPRLHSLEVDDTGASSNDLIWERAQPELVTEQGKASSRALVPGNLVDVARFVAPFRIRLIASTVPIYWATWDDDAPTLNFFDKLAGEPSAEEGTRSAIIEAGVEITVAYLVETLGWPESLAYVCTWHRMGNDVVAGLLNDSDDV